MSRLPLARRSPKLAGLGFCLICLIWLIWLACLAGLTGLTCPLNPFTPAPAYSAGAERASDAAAMELLREAAVHAASLQSLSAVFRQEKRMQELVEPLQASGSLCLSRTPAAGNRVVWIYDAPLRSGFMLENGQISLWEKDIHARRPASSQETAYLASMVRSIQSWLVLDPQRLSREYTITRPDPLQRQLVLFPTQASPFSEVRVLFGASLETLESLHFIEANGDSVQLYFSDVRLNSPLPPQCIP